MPASVPARMGGSLTAKGRLAQETERHPEMWLTQVESEGHGLVESVPLSREEQGDEFLLMGLRLSEGVDPRAFERRSAAAISTLTGSRAWSRTGLSNATSAAASG